jgi:DNA gyrase subunit B
MALTGSPQPSISWVLYAFFICSWLFIAVNGFGYPRHVNPSRMCLGASNNKLLMVKQPRQGPTSRFTGNAIVAGNVHHYPMPRFARSDAFPHQLPSSKLWAVPDGEGLVSPASDYGSQSITVLKGLEPVRLRPGMYIGSTGSRGLHHLVYEVVDNSVDEALAGHCTDINITLLDDGMVIVEDNGRGIPCEIHAATGKSSLETVLCVLHAGAKFGGESSGYSVSGGLHGVGISVVNALSERLSVTIYRDGFQHSMSFARGNPVTPLLSEKLPSEERSKRGTRILFKPDDLIFKSDRVFDDKVLAKRFDELSFLNPGLQFRLMDRRNGTQTEKIFSHVGGISELLGELCKGKKSVHGKVPIITIFHKARPASGNTKIAKAGISVDVALQWSEDSFSNENVLSFVNNINTIDGGTHVDGLRASLSKVVNQFARKV